MPALNLLVPITLILTLGFVVGFLLLLSYRTKRENTRTIHASIKLLIESGQQITPELLERISGTRSAVRELDLRKGVISVALGLSISVFGLFVSGYEDMAVFAGISAIPIILGIAYLGLWKFSSAKD